MSWIKRHLYFLIGAVVAFVLLGLAGFYLYSKLSLNSKNLEALNQAYEDLKKNNSQNPHPGSGNVNNIDTAREQTKELRAYMEKTHRYFEKIPPIPDLPKIADRDFSSALDRTIAQLSRDGTNSSVALPPTYSFSFQAQRSKMNFAPGSLAPLADQLGEVKTICDILFAAKVNSLDSIRRERVSPDDAAGAIGDYLQEKSTTNSLAVLTPYEVTFHCFSPELASVLTGLAGSTHGLLVQFINVEIAAAAAPVDPVTGVVPPTAVYNPVVSAVPGAVPGSTMTPDQAFRQRYGISGGGRGGEGGPDFRSRYGKQPGPAPVPQQQPVPVVAAVPTKTGLPTVIDEKQLKVTIMINVVKLIPPATK